MLVQTLVVVDGQIIADHSIVDQFDSIPQQYIDSVKTMLVSISGESHSQAYRFGMDLLEKMDSTYQAMTYDDNTPPSITDQYLRIGRQFIMGEDYVFSQTKIALLKDKITSQNNTGNPFNVMGFGWCWDMTDDNDPGGLEDTVYHVRWAGRSEGGPNGNMRWGLDSDDQVLTGNSVSMDTYLEAVEAYILHCKENAYPTKWIFTTGPVDYHGGTENGFQREIKQDHIRAYVAEDESRILFDYADILCWNDSAVQNLADWDDEGNIRPHAQIHPDNMMDYDESWNLIAHSEDGDHIGEVGTIRLAKAMWWMLARIVGWEGLIIPVDGITVSSEGGVEQVYVADTLRFTALVTPTDATYQAVSWSVTNGSGSASIGENGLLTAGNPGNVTVVATAQDSSQVTGSFSLMIISREILLTSVTIGSAGGITELKSGAELQFSALVLPDTASNKELDWSVSNGTGTASISMQGLLTADIPGTVTVVATAQDGSGVNDLFTLTILIPSAIGESESGIVILHPNPGIGLFYLNTGGLEVKLIQVVSAHGGVVLDLNPEPGNRVIELNLSRQQTGLYFIKALAEDHYIVKRAIIIR